MVYILTGLNCGLKQGCLLSPRLFSLYINNLAEEIKNLDIGVSIGESILLYNADDIILLSETEIGLQKTLGCLSQWCLRWQLVIDGVKTNVIHFRGVTMPSSEISITSITSC